MKKLVVIDSTSTLAFFRGMVVHMVTPAADGIVGSADVPPYAKKLMLMIYAGWPARAYLRTIFIVTGLAYL